MLYLAISMIIGGLFITGWGLATAHKPKGVYQTIAAILAPLGLICALVGVLLLCVPNFFGS